MTKITQGTVRFVGAGPGDPSLLTVRADALLRSASVVLHDDLVAREILGLAPSDAVVLNVGKRCGRKRISQSEINALMVSFARRGFDSIRLKSGDPAVFGRLAEEIEALSAAGVAFEIVPGVSAGMAAASSLGFSLTDRRLSSRVVFTSAHHAPGKDAAPGENWRGLANEDTTLVIYMPGHNLDRLQEELLAAGLAPETPAVIVSRASTPAQREHHATLATLAASPVVEAPSILLLGRAVASRTQTDPLDSSPAAAESDWESFLDLLAPETSFARVASLELNERKRTR